MGAETCECGEADCYTLQDARLRNPTPPQIIRHWHRAYERQRARADAAERERDAAFADLGRMNAEMNDHFRAADATIASLREEVERLRREAALSPPQADAQVCKCERRARGWRHNHGNCPVHPAPSGRFPDHNGPGGPVWIEEDDATTTQGGEG